MAFAIIEEHMSSPADGIHDQVQGPIAVEINQRRSGGVQVFASDSRLFGDVFKFPMTQVSEESITASQPTKIKIAQAIPIHVARGHARAVRQNLAGQGPLLRERVREENARFSRGQ